MDVNDHDCDDRNENDCDQRDEDFNGECCGDHDGDDVRYERYDDDENDDHDGKTTATKNTNGKDDNGLKCSGRCGVADGIDAVTVEPSLDGRRVQPLTTDFKSMNDHYDESIIRHNSSSNDLEGVVDYKDQIVTPKARQHHDTAEDVVTLQTYLHAQRVRFQKWKQKQRRNRKLHLLQNKSSSDSSGSSYYDDDKDDNNVNVHDSSHPISSSDTKRNQRRKRKFRYYCCHGSRCSYKYYFVTCLMASTRILIVSINLELFSLYSNGYIMNSSESGGTTYLLRSIDRIVFVITYGIFLSSSFLSWIQRYCLIGLNRCGRLLFCNILEENPCTTRASTAPSAVTMERKFLEEEMNAENNPQKQPKSCQQVHHDEDLKGKKTSSTNRRTWMVIMSLVFGTICAVTAIWLLLCIDDDTILNKLGGRNEGNKNAAFGILMNPYLYQGDAHVTGFSIIQEEDDDDGRWCQDYSDGIPVNVTVSWGGSWGCPTMQDESSSFPYCDDVSIPTVVSCRFKNLFYGIAPHDDINRDADDAVEITEYDYVSYRYHTTINEYQGLDDDGDGDANDVNEDVDDEGDDKYQVQYAFDEYDRSSPPPSSTTSRSSYYWNHPAEWILGDCKRCTAISRPILIEQLKRKSPIAHGIFVSIGLVLSFFFYSAWAVTTCCLRQRTQRSSYNQPRTNFGPASASSRCPNMDVSEQDHGVGGSRLLELPTTTNDLK